RPGARAATRRRSRPPGWRARSRTGSCRPWLRPSTSRPWRPPTSSAPAGPATSPRQLTSWPRRAPGRSPARPSMSTAARSPPAEPGRASGPARGRAGGLAPPRPAPAGDCAGGRRPASPGKGIARGVAIGVLRNYTHWGCARRPRRIGMLDSAAAARAASVGNGRPGEPARRCQRNPAMTNAEAPVGSGLPAGSGRLAQVIATRRGTAAPEAPFVIEHREALIYMLCEAAELEHGIMCQYLFAAFSLKQSTDEGLTEDELAAANRWRKQVLHVATQERLHLALVQNLLTAIGGPQHLDRPKLPHT